MHERKKVRPRPASNTSKVLLGLPPTGYAQGFMTRRPIAFAECRFRPFIRVRYEQRPTPALAASMFASIRAAMMS